MAPVERRLKECSKWVKKYLSFFSILDSMYVFGSLNLFLGLVFGLDHRCATRRDWSPFLVYFRDINRFIGFLRSLNPFQGSFLVLIHWDVSFGVESSSESFEIQPKLWFSPLQWHPTRPELRNNPINRFSDLENLKIDHYCEENAMMEVQSPLMAL